MEEIKREYLLSNLDQVLKSKKSNLSPEDRETLKTLRNQIEIANSKEELVKYIDLVLKFIGVSVTVFKAFIE